MRRTRSLSFLAAAALGFAALGARAEVDKKVARIWKSKCASCHGATGNGDTEMGKKDKLADLTKPEWQKTKTDAEIKTLILDGIKREKDGVKVEMDAFKDKGVTPEQADGLVALIRALK